MDQKLIKIYLYLLVITSVGENRSMNRSHEIVKKMLITVNDEIICTFMNIEYFDQEMGQNIQYS